MSQLLLSEESLRHYGIPGMHWGKGKRSISKSKVARPKSEPINKPRRMSSKELNSRIKRLKLEKEFDQLANPKPQTLVTINNIVKAAGTVAALTTSAATIYKNINILTKVASGMRV